MAVAAGAGVYKALAAEPPPAVVPEGEAPAARQPDTTKEQADLPRGHGPAQAMVTLNGVRDKLSVRFMQTMVEWIQVDKNGAPRTDVTTRQKEVTGQYDLAKIQVSNIKGKKIHAKELQDLLKGETLVLIKWANNEIDPLHLRLYKEDTLVICLPAGPTTGDKPIGVPPRTVPPARDDPNRVPPPIVVPPPATRPPVAVPLPQPPPTTLPPVAAPPPVAVPRAEPPASTPPPLTPPPAEPPASTPPPGPIS